jgi:hypothetical protein
MEADEEDSWSVDTVVEVLELDCECLQSGGPVRGSLPDCLLLFCLACLVFRIIQVLFELLMNLVLQKEFVDLVPAADDNLPP